MSTTSPIPFNDLSRTSPDMAAKVAFLAGETGAQGAAAQRVRLVARAAIRGEKGAEYVLVVKEGVLERRAVTVGPTASDPAEVLSGVTNGEQVVIEGPADLAAGARVKVTSGK